MEEVKSKGLHILVAEDNIVNQRVAMKLLQKWGHTTVLACNGQEAVEMALEEPFDLILMDVSSNDRKGGVGLLVLNLLR